MTVHTAMEKYTILIITAQLTVTAGHKLLLVTMEAGHDLIVRVVV